MTEAELIELWRATRPHADWETRAAEYGRAVEAAVRDKVAREIAQRSGGSRLPQDVAYSDAARIALGQL